jgi:uncharacterized protein (TIGR03032 family)
VPGVCASIANLVLIVGPPSSGGDVVASALARASGVWHTAGSADLVEGAVPHVGLGARGWPGHQLDAEDAAGHENGVRHAIARALVDREGRPLRDGGEAPLAVVWSARSALRIGFWDRALPGCRFVLCARDPSAATEEMLRAWQSGRFVSVPDLPGWTGPSWSLSLIPDWQALIGEPLERIVVEQWAVLAERALSALEGLPPDRWAICEFGRLLEDPRAELRRLCEFLSVPYDQALLSPVEETRRQLELSLPRPSAELVDRLPRARPVMTRFEELIAPAPVTTARAHAAPDASPFRSVFTGAFARVLSELQASLLISTYQSGRLICARVNGGMLNTHLRVFDKPMGIAASRNRFALGTRAEVWDFRDAPAVAPKIEPRGVHDACFLPRNIHVTGDILVHELAFDGQGELWGVATAFSCLVTFDGDSSFLPRWRPSFISELAPGDRCHLNGICIRDGRPAYVTALGTSDTSGGWRERKASGGCLIDLSNSEIVAGQLSMPHSPRWHDGRLWLLESGRGELVQVDPESGAAVTVAELPGFTRGLAMAGNVAFVGLSQIRESSTFGDLPLIERLDERVCGVWAIDLRTGDVVGLLRFDDLVQEIFDVALLPGVRYPEIAELGSSAAAVSFAVG